MSCPHGNFTDACDICDEVAAACNSGVEHTKLAQTEQEPVARYEKRHPLETYGWRSCGIADFNYWQTQTGWEVRKLFTSPPKRQQDCDECQQLREQNTMLDANLAELEAQAQRQLLTTEQYTALAHRIASKYSHRSDLTFTAYTFLPHTLEQFARAIELHHGIGDKT